MRFYSNF